MGASNVEHRELAIH